MAALLSTESSLGKDLVGVYEDALRNDPQSGQPMLTGSPHASRVRKHGPLYCPQISGAAAYTRDHPSGYQDQIEENPLHQRLFLVPLPYTANNTEKQWGLTLRQNMFSWSNWQALKAASSQVAQAEANYAAAEQNLVLRASQAYFNVLSNQDNLEGQASLQAIARQLDQADKRYDVGLIAITDVEAKAARDTAAAAVIAAKRTLATAEDQLAEITGEKYDVPSKSGTDMPLNMPEPAEEGRWVDISLEQNATLVSSRPAADIICLRSIWWPAARSRSRAAFLTIRRSVG